MAPYNQPTAFHPKSSHACCQHQGCRTHCDCPEQMSWNPLNIWSNMMCGYVGAVSAGVGAFMKVCCAGEYCSGRDGYCGRCDNHYCRCENYCFRCLEPLSKVSSETPSTEIPSLEFSPAAMQEVAMRLNTTKNEFSKLMEAFCHVIPVSPQGEKSSSSAAKKKVVARKKQRPKKTPQG